MIPLAPDAPHIFASRPPDDDDEGEGFEDVTQPDEQDNWYHDLGEASGLNTSPDQGLLSPTGPAMEESSSFAMVVSKAAETLGLSVPSVEIKTSI